MSGRISTLLSDSSKVAIATWAVAGIEPYLEGIIPSVPEFVRVLVAAMIAGVALEFFLQIIIGYPRINIEWLEKNDNTPLSGLIARIRPSNRESQPFTLKVYVESGGWMSEWIVRRLISPDLKVHVEIDRLMARSMVDSSSRTSLDGNSAVLPNVAGSGFEISLGAPPNSSGIWQWAEVRWINEETPPGGEFSITCSFLHPSTSKARIANTLLPVRSSAKNFRIVGG